MSAPVLTFAQFVATGRDSADLHEVQDECVDGPGRVYLVTDTGALYIHRWGGSAGEWCLVIGNEQVTGELADLERALYEFACSEGYCQRDLQGAVPCGLNADWSYAAWHFGPSARANRNAGDVYVLDTEDGEFAVVRSCEPDADENPVTEELGSYPHWDAAADAARALVAGGGQ